MMIESIRMSIDLATTISKRSKAAVDRVPLLDLARQYKSLRAEILLAIETVCDSQQYILGKEVESFEAEVSAFCGVDFSLGCASGTDALWLALAAARVGPGDEVITTPFTFFASVSSITRASAKPILVDVDPLTLNLDPKKVQDRIQRGSARLKAIMPVHLYGQCADMDAFACLAKEYKLVIVEDAAQAFGAAWSGRRAGSLGDIAGFSFYPTKNLSAFGDAGCVTTNNEEFAKRVALLRNHGSRKRYYHEEVGWNSRLDSIQAAVLRIKLKHIEEWNRQRQLRAEVYNRLFKEAGLLNAGGNARRSPTEFRGIRLLQTRAEATHVYHQYVIRSSRRDELQGFLKQRNIGSEVYYPLALHQQECFRYLGYAESDLPESTRAAREVLALPIFPELILEEQQYVVNAIADFYS